MTLEFVPMRRRAGVSARFVICDSRSVLCVRVVYVHLLFFVIAIRNRWGRGEILFLFPFVDIYVGESLAI